MRLGPVAVILLLAGLALGTAGASGSPAPEAARLAIHEGRVTAIGQAEGEGGLPVVSIELEEPAGSVTVLLAPASVLEEAEFEVALGDQLKIRVFVMEGDEPLRAHKVFNQTKNTMLRLRTLGDVPLWNDAGRWQGGRGGRGAGGEAPHRQGPAGGSGRGPGGGRVR